MTLKAVLSHTAMLNYYQSVLGYNHITLKDAILSTIKKQNTMKITQTGEKEFRLGNSAGWTIGPLTAQELALLILDCSDEGELAALSKAPTKEARLMAHNIQTAVTIFMEANK